MAASIWMPIPPRTDRSPQETGMRLLVILGFLLGTSAWTQQAAPAEAPQFLTPTPMAPLFFRETWWQSRPFDASTGFRPEAGVTSAAVTNPALELRLYDPQARNIPEFLKNPPP